MVVIHLIPMPEQTPSSSDNNPHKRLRLLPTLGYILGTIMFFGGLSLLLHGQIFSGLFDMLAGLSAFPPFWRIVRDKKGWAPSRTSKILLVFVFIFFSGLATGF